MKSYKNNVQQFFWQLTIVGAVGFAAVMLGALYFDVHGNGPTYAGLVCLGASLLGAWGVHPDWYK